MTRITSMLGAAAICLALAAVALPPAHARQSTTPVQAAAQSVPAYHSAPPVGVLPATLPAKGFGDPLTHKAYTFAARIKPLLYQLPCYCRCDRAAGHTSLLSCYGDLHGSECEVCKKELFYAYEQNRHGRTVRQIRAGIIGGDWKNVDLGKYAPPLVSGAPAKP